MNKKTLLVSLALITTLVVPFSVFAATSNTTAAKNIRSFLRIDTSKLTDQQKSDIKNYSQKMADLQKDFINQMVSNGTITKDQGDAEIQRIEDRLNTENANGLLPGLGMGQRGPGRKGDFVFGGIDTSKLTDQQKADLTSSYKAIADLHKDLVNKMVSNGLITKDQGDNIIEKIDTMISNIETNSLNKGMGMFMGGFGLNIFGRNQSDSSKLTDQQKTDFADFSTKLTALQKDLINKMVADGALTKDQGDAAIQRIDAMSKNGFPQGPGMMKGRMGGHGRKNF